MTPRKGSLLVYGDMTAPNTPTGNELTFMSPNLMKNDKKSKIIIDDKISEKLKFVGKVNASKKDNGKAPS